MKVMAEDWDSGAALAAVKGEIAEAAREAGRDPGDISLVAVSKVHDAERIRPALEAGHRLFGENRVQEAAGKWPVLREEFPDLVLHLIGPLQSNKTKQAVEVFDVIESVDRPKIARALAGEFERIGRSLPVFVQVNTGEEAQKAGVLPADVDAFIKDCTDNLGLDVKGLMCIPPVDEEPALHFKLLADMAERNGLSGLSMGMSADFRTAIALGATHVRVGTAIFGTRT